MPEQEQGSLSQVFFGADQKKAVDVKKTNLLNNRKDESFQLNSLGGPLDEQFIEKD